MSIRPVDMQLVMPRTVESVGKAAQDNARPNEQMHRFTQEMTQQAERDQHTVVSAYKPDEGRVNEDGRRKQEEEQKKKRRDKEKEKGKQSGRKPPSQSSGLGIDFSV